MNIQVLRIVDGRDFREEWPNMAEFTVFTESGLLQLTTKAKKYIYYAPGAWVRVMEVDSNGASIH